MFDPVPEFIPIFSNTHEETTGSLRQNPPCSISESLSILYKETT